MTAEDAGRLDIAGGESGMRIRAPGCEGTDIAECLHQLDRLTAHVSRRHERNWHRWIENPSEYQNSEAYYRMGILVTAVRLDYGARYNPEFAADPSKPLTRDDLFFRRRIECLPQGLLSAKKTGTCSSMPVLYTAIARRLGYQSISSPPRPPVLPLDGRV